MKCVRPEQIGFSRCRPQVNSLAKRRGPQLAAFSQDTANFHCRNLTFAPTGYRHQQCAVVHYAGPPAIVVRKSSVHGFGVFAHAALAKGAVICEYTGVVLSSLLLTDLVERTLLDAGFDSTYLFQVGSQLKAIDATFAGSAARFANHSCSPNCEAQKLSGRVFLVALRKIEIGEEICYNYRLRRIPGRERIPCHCGSAQCTGWMDSGE